MSKRLWSCIYHCSNSIGCFHPKRSRDVAQRRSTHVCRSNLQLYSNSESSSSGSIILKWSCSKSSKKFINKFTVCQKLSKDHRFTCQKLCHQKSTVSQITIGLLDSTVLFFLFMCVEIFSDLPLQSFFCLWSSHRPQLRFIFSSPLPHLVLSSASV